VNVTVAVKTDVGRTRDANEDSYLADGPLFGIADGMGGHVAGDIASQTTVKVITEAAAEHPPEKPEDLESYVVAANRAVYEQAQGDPRLKGMGTTCTIVFVQGSSAHLAHVGDSRAYLFRNGELSQVTEDHSLVQRMVQEGKLRQEDAPRHPQRNIISRALGVEPEVQVDLLTLELLAGDRLIVNSDGLSDMLSDDEIRDVLAETSGPEEAAEKLVTAANEAGGVDNITVVVLDVEDDGGSPQPARVAAEPRTETEEEPSPQVTESRSGSRIGRTVLVTFVVIALLAGVAYGATRYALANSWYVGASDDGTITIYKGIPDEVAGLTLKEEVERSTLLVKDLPPSWRSDVAEGIKQDSLEDAKATLLNFRELIKNFQDAGSGSSGGKGTNSGDGKK
jgi:protein phosphatase